MYQIMGNVMMAMPAQPTTVVRGHPASRVLWWTVTTTTFVPSTNVIVVSDASPHWPKKVCHAAKLTTGCVSRANAHASQIARVGNVAVMVAKVVAVNAREKSSAPRASACSPSPSLILA